MTTITVLVENTARRGELRAEHGFSALVEHGGSRVLFDTGASDAFFDNAATLGCDLVHVDALAISHGHWDHTGGLVRALTYFIEKGVQPPVIFHPDMQLYRRRGPEEAKRSGERDLSMPEEARKLLQSFPLNISSEPVWINESLVWLGQIPRKDTTTMALIGEVKREGIYERDEILDDTALACITPEGLNIVVGCAHAGIINIVEQAKAVTGVTTINAVIGGLHTKGVSAQALEIVTRYLRVQAIPHLYACHCSGDALARAGLGKELSGGDILAL